MSYTDGFCIRTSTTYISNTPYSKTVIGILYLNSIEKRELQERIIFDRIVMRDCKKTQKQVDRYLYDKYFVPTDMDEKIQYKCGLTNVVEYQISKIMNYCAETKYMGFVITKNNDNQYAAYVMYSSGGKEWFVQQLFELDHKLNSFKED